jgi:hypothetical protein
MPSMALAGMIDEHDGPLLGVFRAVGGAFAVLTVVAGVAVLILSALGGNEGGVARESPTPAEGVLSGGAPRGPAESQPLPTPVAVGSFGDAGSSPTMSPDAEAAQPGAGAGAPPGIGAGGPVAPSAGPLPSFSATRPSATPAPTPPAITRPPAASPTALPTSAPTPSPTPTPIPPPPTPAPTPAPTLAPTPSPIPLPSLAPLPSELPPSLP